MFIVRVVAVLAPIVTLMSLHVVGPDPAPLAGPTPVVAEKAEKTGNIGAWYVFADGTVGLKLVGQDKGQSFATWFITPADRTETTRFEHLILATALDLAASRDPLTIAYEFSNEKTGKTIKDAVPIHAVMWGTAMAEAEKTPAPRK